MKQALFFLILLLCPHILWAEPLTLLRCAENSDGALREVRIDKNLQEIRLYLHANDDLVSQVARLTASLSDEASDPVDFMLIRVPFEACQISQNSHFQCRNFLSRAEFSSPLGGLVSPDHVMELTFQLLNDEKTPVFIELLSLEVGHLLRLEMDPTQCSGNTLMSIQFLQSVENVVDSLIP